MNAVCSNQSKGWLCVRSQQLEKVTEYDAYKKRAPPPAQNIKWCSGSDDWGDDDDDDGYNQLATDYNNQQCVAAVDINEQNGNFVVISKKNDNSNSMSEDEEESNSLESDPIPSFGNLQVVDDKNANCGDQGSVPILFIVFLTYLISYLIFEILYQVEL